MPCSYRGPITAQMATTISWRTMLITDHTVWAQLDAALADSHTQWGPMTHEKLANSIDFWITLFDPDAVRRTHTAARGRTIIIGDREDTDGLVSLFGRMLATDAALLREQITAMADGVCTDDPRTRPQRLSEALGALAAKADHLACLCGNPDCPATRADGRAAHITIHIVAAATALDLTPDPLIHGDGSTPRQPQPEPAPEPPAEPFMAETRGPTTTPPEPEAEVPEAPTASTPSARPSPATQPAGVIVGGGIVPAPLLAELIRTGAKIRPIKSPNPQAEPHYRPTTALADFTRARDLTCRAPGCNRPAYYTDIDHSVPYPAGITHACNTHCKCRQHHLIKTFWTGQGGWTEQQLPDGTLLTTSPAGITYRTRPGSTLYFPDWNIHTPPPTGPPPHGVKPPGNSLDTFKRKHTRTQQRARHIQTERARNAARTAEERGGAPF